MLAIKVLNGPKALGGRTWNSRNTVSMKSQQNLLLFKSVIKCRHDGKLASDMTTSANAKSIYTLSSEV